MSDEPTCCAGSDGNHSDYCPRHAAQAESELAPARGSATGEVLEDGTEILHDQTTETTRWVLYRHHKTKGLNIALVQHGNKVSVTVKNLKYMLGEIVPNHESPNDKLSD
jgi:hypothetical protein